MAQDFRRHEISDRIWALLEPLEKGHRDVMQKMTGNL